MGRVNKWRRRLSELPTFKSQEAPDRDRPLASPVLFLPDVGCSNITNMKSHGISLDMDWILHSKWATGVLQYMGTI
jgi:hypothetical protein